MLTILANRVIVPQPDEHTSNYANELADLGFRRPHEREGLPLMVAPRNARVVPDGKCVRVYSARGDLLCEFNGEQGEKPKGVTYMMNAREILAHAGHERFQPEFDPIFTDEFGC